MTQYFITTPVPANADWYKLVQILTNAGLPIVDVQTSEAYPGQIIVVSNPDLPELTQSQQTLMNSLVASFDPRPRVTRPLYAIYNDLVVLTAAQQTAIWNDFNSGTTPKYLLDVGPNAAALAVLDWAIKKSGASGTSLADARLRAVAIYTQDNPKYLVNPTFANTVNVPGDQPVG